MPEEPEVQSDAFLVSGLLSPLLVTGGFGDIWNAPAPTPPSGGNPGNESGPPLGGMAARSLSVFIGEDVY